MRPTYHFAPARNWMNDPNGTVYDNGTYHLFYQYNPDGAEWGNIQWAYATSPDLVNWTRKGLKLTPENERYCFSGCALRKGERMKLFYTSIGFEPDAVQHHAVQRIAEADPAFERIDRNGYEIADTVHPFPVAEWRDPFVFVFRGTYYMTMAGIGDGKNAIFLYKTDDPELNAWSYSGILFSVEDDILECPNVAVFGDRIALVYSAVRERRVKYATGRFDGERFEPTYYGNVDEGVGCFYASNLSSSQTGDYVLYGWLQEGLTGSPSPDGTYSGCLALPRIIRLSPSGALEFEPVPTVSKLYKRVLVSADTATRTVVTDASPRTRVTFAAGDFTVRLMEGAGEYLRIRRTGARLSIENVCTRPDARVDEQRAILPEGKLRFDIFTDGSVCEVYAGNHAVVSLRFYGRSRERALTVEAGTLENLTVYSLAEADIKESV